MTSTGKLRIGDWRVDPVVGLIFRDGRTERLDARTLRLLLELAEHPGETVSIDDLLNRVWAGVIVTPDSVYQAVATLRRVLGDDLQRPRYIATVPRLGYRLVARVEPWSDALDPTVAPGAAPMPRPRRLGLVAAGLVVALAGIGGLFVFARGREVATPSVGVLMFLDMTSTMDNEVMVDDFTERLATRLGQDSRLKTPGFRAALALKGKHLRPVEAARALGVAYVVDGSVHSQGAGYRLTANLIRADNGFVVWTRGYDETAQGMLAAPDAVAADLTRALAAQASAN